MVLADVRGLSATTPGIRFEVEQLAAHVERARILLLTNSKTDMRLLQTHFGTTDGMPLPALELSGRPYRDTPRVLEALVHAAFGSRSGMATPEALPARWAHALAAARPSH